MFNGLNYKLDTVKFKHETSSVSQMDASGREVVTIVYPAGNISGFVLRLNGGEII